MIIRTTRAGPDTTLALVRETPWGLATSNMGPGECPPGISSWWWHHG